ncbi:MAG: hypothetical protein AB8G05_24875 [Oligoflexales bacterium]
MKLKRLKKIIFGSFLGLSLVALTGCFRHKTPEQKLAYMSEKVEEKLELNQSQKLKLKEFSDTVLVHYDQGKNLRKNNKEKVFALLGGQKIDRGEAKSLLDSSEVFLSGSAQDILDKFIDFHDTLDDKQRQKIAEFVAKYKNRHD